MESAPAQSVQIKARSSFKYEVPIDACDQFVEWQWRLDAYDIAFSLTFHPAPSHSNSSTPLTLHSPPAPISSGHVLCSSSYTHASSTPGSLVFLFSNLHSSFRAKQLHLTVTSHPHHPLPYGLTLSTPLGPTTVLSCSSPSIYHCHLPYASAFLHSSFLLPHWSPDARLLPSTPASLNRRCMWGVWLFFTNHLEESEHFFQSELSHSPMFSISYACIGFLRALMTWEREDTAEADRRLNRSRAQVAPALPPQGRLAGLGRLFSAPAPLTSPQLEATLMTAETLILQAMLLLIQENVLAFIQAGLKIRSSHLLFQRCWAEVQRRERAQAVGEVVEPLDPQVLGGVQNGMGSFAVVMSLLPPIVLRLLSFLGYSANRREGLRLLHASAAGEGLRSPLSALMLLFLHVVIPSFFSLHMRYHLQQSNTVFDAMFQRYPNGSFFLWLLGRQQRLDRRLTDALRSFHRAAAGQPHWRQLQHLCAYELGLTHYFLLDFERSQPYWEVLEKENQWSKGFYGYMLCIPHIERAQDPHASAEERERERADADATVARVDAACERKFGGKQLSLEQFILQRVGEWKKGRRLVLPTLEVVYLYHGFPCMQPPLLQRCLQMVEAELGQSPFWTASTAASHPTPSPSQPPSDVSIANHCLLLLMYASLLHHLGRSHEALPHLQFVIGQASALAGDFYLVPFAQFETATIHMALLLQQEAGEKTDGGECDWTVADVREEYRKASGYREAYHFKNRLHLRIHLAVTELKSGVRGEKFEEAVADDEEVEGEEGLEGLSDADRTLMELANKAAQEADQADAVHS